MVEDKLSKGTLVLTRKVSPKCKVECLGSDSSLTRNPYPNGIWDVMGFYMYQERV